MDLSNSLKMFDFEKNTTTISENIIHQDYDFLLHVTKVGLAPAEAALDQSELSIQVT